MKKFAYISILVLAIGMMVASPMMPLTGNVAIAQESASPTAGIPNTGDESDLSLGWFDGAVANIVKWLVYSPSAFVLWLSGQIIDFTAEYSLGIGGGENIYKSNFIAEGWEIVRDIANMGFIFAMLYIAILTILRATTNQTWQMLVWVIIIALLVNFSLFFSQVVVDASNILGLEFYTALTDTGDDGTRSLSSIFLTGFNPQKLGGTDIFRSWVVDNGKGVSLLIALYFLAAAIQIYAAWILLVAAFLFLGRIAMLWILMVASPIAFVAYIFPKTRGKFQEWANRLLSQAFMAPVFLFFFFLIAKFILLIGDLDTPEGTNDFFTEILDVTIPFIFLAILLRTSINVTKKMSGEIAQAATSAAKFTAGAGLAVASGGAALGAASKLGLGGQRVGRALTAPTRTAGRAVRGTLGRRLRGQLGEFSETSIAEKEPEGAPRSRAERLVRRVRQTRGGRAIASALGAGRVGARARKDIDSVKEENKELSDAALKAKFGSLTSEPARAAIMELLAERKNLQPDDAGFTKERIEETVNAMKRRGRDTKKIEELAIQYTPEEEMKVEEGMSEEERTEVKKRRDRIFSKTDPETVAKVASDERYINFFRDENGNPEGQLIGSMLAQFGKKHMTELLDATGEVAQKNQEAVFKYLAQEAEKTDLNPADYIQNNLNNPKLAGYMRSPEGRNLMSGWLPQLRQEEEGGEDKKQEQQSNIVQPGTEEFRQTEEEIRRRNNE